MAKRKAKQQTTRKKTVRAAAKNAKKSKPTKRAVKSTTRAKAVKSAKGRNSTKPTVAKEVSKTKRTGRTDRTVPAKAAPRLTPETVPEQSSPVSEPSVAVDVRHTAEVSEPATVPSSPLSTISQTTGHVEPQPHFLQGQRVRHRYEHWWGTIVQKADPSPENPDLRRPVRYIVTVDDGRIRDDIRPEDLTISR